MAKSNIKDAWAALVAAIEESLKRQNFQQVATKARDVIYTRTKLGYGVKRSGQKRQPLKELSDKYIEQRGGKVSQNKKGKRTVRANKGSAGFQELHPTTAPGKSNLTRTGQLLASLEGKAVQTGRAEIKPTGNRKGNGEPTNEEVAQYVTDGGRSFLELSDLEFKQLEEVLRRDILSRVEKSLKKT